MPMGDKYAQLTQYLKGLYSQGRDCVELTFPEIEAVLGFPLARHILSLSIDSRLEAGDLILVPDIGHITYPNGSSYYF